MAQQIQRCSHQRLYLVLVLLTNFYSLVKLVEKLVAVCSVLELAFSQGKPINLSLKHMENYS